MSYITYGVLKLKLYRLKVQFVFKTIMYNFILEFFIKN